MKQEEDSDASSDDETAFVSMSDRWKEEWNHGVQVIFILLYFLLFCVKSSEYYYLKFDII